MGTLGTLGPSGYPLISLTGACPTCRIGRRGGFSGNEGKTVLSNVTLEAVEDAAEVMGVDPWLLLVALRPSALNEGVVLHA